MSKHILLLSVFLALFASGFGQFFYYARLTGDKMVPPVNSARTAGLQVSFFPTGDPTAPNEFPVGLDFGYSLTTDINDVTGFTIYAPAQSDTGPVLIEFNSNAKTGQKLLTVPGGNDSAVYAYRQTLDTYFRIGFAFVILRTTAFPNGELRGKFGGSLTSSEPRFLGATLFQFPLTDAISPLVFVQCSTVTTTGEKACQWNSAYPLGASVQLQGPNNLLIPLIPFQQVGPGILPGISGSGTFTVPAPFTVDQFIDFGYRGELRLAYKIGTIDVGSTALAITGKPPTFEANLNGANVVPPVTTTATGTVETVVRQRHTLSLSHTVVNATSFFLSNGSTGVNGAELNILPGIYPIPSDIEGVELDFMVTFGFSDILASGGQPYLTIASQAYPQGEIRGKYIIHPTDDFIDSLSGQKMVPAVTSASTGQAVLRYDSILDALYFNISSTSTSTSAVVLRGPANSDSTGPVLATLCSFKCNLRRIFFGALKQGSAAFSSGQTLSSTVDILLQGKAYVELQTTQNPSGELRANLVASINNNPPIQGEDTAGLRPDIDILAPIPTPAPSIPRFFRRRGKL